MDCLAIATMPRVVCRFKLLPCFLSATLLSAKPTCLAPAMKPQFPKTT